jgi:cell division protein FtsX
VSNDRTESEAVLLSASGARVDAEVFMGVDATALQIDAVRQSLAADPDVRSVRFLDKEAAYTEFKRIFRDQPALIASTTADALPTSFRVQLRDGANPDAFARRHDLNVSAGIDVVMIGSSACG